LQRCKIIPCEVLSMDGALLGNSEVSEALSAPSATQFMNVVKLFPLFGAAATAAAVAVVAAAVVVAVAVACCCSAGTAGLYAGYLGGSIYR
jgi:hypothetical protein